MPIKITPILLPKTKEEVEAATKKIFGAAKALKIEVDPDGFVRAWMADSTRVVLAMDGDIPVGLATMAFGRRYYDQRFTASVIFAEGPARNEMLLYMKDMAAVLGAEVFIYETDGNDTLGGEDGMVRFVRI